MLRKPSLPPVKKAARARAIPARHSIQQTFLDKTPRWPSSPWPAAPAPALTPAQADALVGVWEVQSGLDLSGHRFDAALKAAVAAGAAAGAPVDLAAVFEEAAVEITAMTFALFYADPATGIFVGYAANTTANATAGYAPVAQLKRYAGHAAPAPGGAVAFTLVQDDDQGE